jgi:hypothetical protein
MMLFLASNIHASGVVLIDPAGNPGRPIHDAFERGLTLQCAQALQEELAISMPNLKVLISKEAGKTINAAHQIMYANRVQPDLYLHISFYPEFNIPAHYALFCYAQNDSDFLHKPRSLQWYSINQAHLKHLHTSNSIAQFFQQHLRTSSLNKAFVCLGQFNVPFTPLYGIQAPALCIEAGLCKSSDWIFLVQPLAQCIQELFS